MPESNGMYDPQKVVPKAREKIHQTILSWFSKQPRGKILDVPAGFGHLSMRLKAMGFQVVSGEIEPEIFTLENMNCVYTDLNTKIDESDNSFDYICCVEGLEHMTDPYQAVAELARVLKEDGYGVFSIPNYSNIEKRFRFFIRGYLTKPKSIEDYRRAGNSLSNFHNTPLTMTLLNLLFEINGLKIEKILRDTVKKKQYFWTPVIAIMKLFAALKSDTAKRKNRYDLTLDNNIILGGNTLIFITKKERKINPSRKNA